MPAYQPLQYLWETLPFSGITDKELQQVPLQGRLQQEKMRMDDDATELGLLCKTAVDVCVK